MSLIDQSGDIRYLIDTVNNISKSILKYDKKSDLLDSLESSVLEIAKIDRQTSFQMKADREVKSIYSESNEKEIHYKDLVENEVNSQIPENFDYKNSIIYKEFSKLRKPNVTQMDDELMILEDNSTKSMLCPITKEIMVQPLKNTTCGHTYSKEGILALLGRNGAVPCPVAACKSVVTKQTLVPDEEMEELIASRQL
ncbi:hypothetical protein WA158_004326 [Blastocystis sp. Blastoise]